MRIGCFVFLYALMTFFANISFAEKNEVNKFLFHENSQQLKKLNVLDINDNETGQRLTVNTGSKMVRKKYAEYYNSKRMEVTENFKMSGSGIIECNTQDDYQKKLLNFLILDDPLNSLLRDLYPP